MAEDSEATNTATPTEPVAPSIASVSTGSVPIVASESSPVPPVASPARHPVRQFKGCSPLSNYNILQKIGEGTFGEVFKAKCKQTGAIVALKRMVLPVEQAPSEELRRKAEFDGFPLIAIREINILKAMDHENVIKLVDMIQQRSSQGGRAKTYFVFPYMDHDLAGIIENKNVKFTEPIVKCYLQQLLQGVRYLHLNNFMHRDIKPANLLIDNEGTLKLTDFGLARPLDFERDGNYTPNVVTRWYRAPEVCMGTKDFGPPVDLWGVGCVFGEMLLRKPILIGKSDIDQLWKIFELCGTPDDKRWPGWKQYPAMQAIKDVRVSPPNIRFTFSKFSKLAIDLLVRLLTLNPKERITADDALDSDYLWTVPLPSKPLDLATLESSHEYSTQTAQERRKAYEKHKAEKAAAAAAAAAKKEERSAVPPPSLMPPMPSPRRTMSSSSNIPPPNLAPPQNYRNNNYNDRNEFHDDQRHRNAINEPYVVNRRPQMEYAPPPPPPHFGSSHDNPPPLPGQAYYAPPPPPLPLNRPHNNYNSHVASGFHEYDAPLPPREDFRLPVNHVSYNNHHSYSQQASDYYDAEPGQMTPPSNYHNYPRNYDDRRHGQQYDNRRYNPCDRRENRRHNSRRSDRDDNRHHGRRGHDHYSPDRSK